MQRSLWSLILLSCVIVTTTAPANAETPNLVPSQDHITAILAQAEAEEAAGNESAARELADHAGALLDELETAPENLIALADRSGSCVWLDRVFRLHAVHGWLIEQATLDEIRDALDKIPRVPGTGLEDYEQALRAMAREGVDVPSRLMTTIAELSDAYSNG